MKINKKQAALTLLHVFGVPKPSVYKENNGIHKVSYRSKPGNGIEYHAYYFEADAKSFLDIYIQSEFVKRYEFVKKDGKVSLQLVS